MEKHEHRLANLACQFVDLHGTSSEPMGYNACPPLSIRVQEELILSQFFMPQLDPNVGTMNTLDHLESYKTLKHIQGVIDALLYTTFLAMLCKVARVWYIISNPRASTPLSNREEVLGIL